MAICIDRNRTPTPRRRGILLVDHDQESLASRATLLVRSDYIVTTAACDQSVLDSSSITGIDIAILSDTLGRSGLRTTAGYVRTRWPEAKILILRIAPLALEYHLYDEAVDHSIQPRKLLEIVARFSGDPSTEETVPALRALEFSVPSLRFRPRLTQNDPAKGARFAQSKDDDERTTGLTNRHSSRSRNWLHVQ